MTINNISAVVFDLGNVLLPFDYSIMVNRLNNVEDGLGERFYKFYKDNYYLHTAFEKGELSEEGFIAKMLEALDNKVDKIDFCKFYSEIFTTNDKLINLLPRIKQKYKLILLSNTNSIHQEYGYKQYEFFNYFDKLVLSHKAGTVKPEKKIYQTVQDFTKLQPEQHIFIDDVLEYVEGAKSMGWNGIQYLSFEYLISEFDKKGVRF